MCMDLEPIATETIFMGIVSIPILVFQKKSINFGPGENIGKIDSKKYHKFFRFVEIFLTVATL